MVSHNPHPWNYPKDQMELKRKGYNWQDYMEFSDNGFPVVCHMCLIREKYGSGNCLDGREYFKCREVDLVKRTVNHVKKSVQITLK